MATDDRLERTELGQSEYEMARGRLNQWLQDAELVVQEAEGVNTQANEALVVEDCLTELDAHLHSLSVEDRQTALDGLTWYAEHYQEDS